MEKMTVTFLWDSAPFVKGSYALSAYAVPVAGETNTANNNVSDGVAKIGIPGDVTGDFLVNIKDASQLGVYWQQHSPPAPANADINGDSVINIKDASIIGVNWQKHA